MLRISLPAKAQQRLGTSDAPLAILEGEDRTGALCLMDVHMTEVEHGSDGLTSCAHCGLVLRHEPAVLQEDRD